MKNRASGILLHITSLPSKFGIGDLGPEAYKFADFLARSKQRYWQVLPLNPSASKTSDSPYNSLSAFAGNILLISPELLYRHGLLIKKDLQDRPALPESRVDYRLVISYKTKLLKTAFERFKSIPKRPDYQLFCSENKSWLEDYATFIALRLHFRPHLWYKWPREFRDLNKQALKYIKVQLQDAIDREKFFQYVFFKQWFSLKKYCNQHSIKIIGDIPIYTDYDSSDAWAHPQNFKLTSTKKPRYIAGVPPDLFSRSGQLWGNPIYNWHVLRKTGYRWWIQRIKHNLRLFDLVRIDHFRGFIAYWQVPAKYRTAKNGRWVRGPGEDFFKTLFRHFSTSSIIVEDLGFITPEVGAFVERFRLTGMRVLLFAFDGDLAKNLHCPHNYIKNCVVYTGTHDNNTTKGWFEKEAGPTQKKRLFDYLGRRVSAGQVAWELIRVAMNSIGDLTIIPMQDALGLGEEARMNRPATMKGNWSWRLLPGQINSSISRKLSKLTEIYGRA